MIIRTEQLEAFARGKGDGAGQMQWGIMQLMHFLLGHCAIFTKSVRNILSRGPMDLYVQSFAS